MAMPARAQQSAMQHDKPMQHSGEMSGDMHEGMEGMMIFAGVPETREASGTAWQPDSTPMHAYHMKLADWTVMTHFNAFFAYDKQWGARGDDQFNSTNWFMLMASRPIGEGELMLRAMLSLEPATATEHGYPLLFPYSEAFHRKSLLDRQHTHYYFME